MGAVKELRFSGAARHDTARHGRGGEERGRGQERGGEAQGREREERGEGGGVWDLYYLYVTVCSVRMGIIESVTSRGAVSAKAVLVT